MTPAETLLARTLLWATVGAAAGFPALVLPAPVDPRSTFVIHLAVIGAFVIGLAFHLAPLSDEPWLAGTDLGVAGRRAVTWGMTVAAVTAAAATVAAATAVCLRYDASMQYLVVLGADAVALPAAAAILGGRRRFGTAVAVGAGVVVVAGVVWSLARYLDVVGVGPGGSWLVDGSRFGTIVLPVIGAALVAAMALFTAGTRRA